MPVGQRLARALSPHHQPWHVLGAAAAFGPATMTALAAPCWIHGGFLGGRRAYAHYTAACCRPQAKDGDEASSVHDQQSRASASIFEELFPGEARPHRTEALGSHEDGVEGKQKQGHPASAPAREELLEEIRQWLESELEAGDAPGTDSSSKPAAAHRTLRTPKGDWGGAPASGVPASTGAPPSVSRAAPRDTQPTVLVLSGTTPSLMPSDFFRIAPRITGSGSSGSSPSSPSSRPVDGWSASQGGIYKIVQDRDPITLAPRGRYFLYFGSPAAALAYAQEIRELHKLARRAIMPAEAGKSNSRRSIRRRNEDRSAVGHGGTFSGDEARAEASETDPFSNITGSITTGGSGLSINSEGSTGGVGVGVGGGRSHSVAKQKNRRTKNSYSNASLLAAGSDEHIEALRSFSLVVPTVRLHLSVQMPADDHDHDHDHQHQGTTYTPSKKSKKNNVQVTLFDGEALDDVAATDATTKVLVVFTLTGNTTSTGSFSNYISADGRGVTTVDGVRSLLAEDGERRNLPWSVAYGLNGVVPVRWLVDEQNRLMRKARAAALQQRQDEHSKAAEEQEAGQEAGQADAEADHEKTQTQKQKPPALPTALWASRVPDLTSKTDYMNEGARFSRFVVSFSDNAEARRFVRGWHRRTVRIKQEHGLPRDAALAAMSAALDRGDDDEQITVPAVVDATVLW